MAASVMIQGRSVLALAPARSDRTSRQKVQARSRTAEPTMRAFCAVATGAKISGPKKARPVHGPGGREPSACCYYLPAGAKLKSAVTLPSAATVTDWVFVPRCSCQASSS